jgi:glycerophosphoryl diester phosphodiesterase
VTWVIAHRGASWEERENTLPAFERAIAMGADFVELDVQATADGALVVFHDLDLDRLTPLTGPLRRRRLAELREHGIPTLAEVVELTRGRVGLMVELKSPHLYRRHDVVGRTVASLHRGDVVLSFQRRALLEARRRRPALRVLQHVGYGVSIRSASRYAWAVGFHDRRVTARGLGRARSLGLETTVYTVNDEARMRQLADLGVSGIFSDRPALLREALSRARPQG